MKYRLKTVGANSYKARWLLLGIFAVGYGATFQAFGSNSIEYFGFTVISALACAMLLTALGPPLTFKLPVWIVLAVFIVAYYTKFYMMVGYPNSMPSELFKRMVWLIKSPETLLNAYATLTYAFVTFCITSWWLLVHTRFHLSRFSRYEINYRSALVILTWVVPLLMLVTTAVMYVTGIAKMAAESVYLPYRLAGWIFYIRTTLIPALLLLLIWCSDTMGNRKSMAFGLLLLFLHGLSDMLLRSSRGSLLLMFMRLLLLFVVTRSITRHRIRVFFVVLLLTMLLWPLITVYRYIRAEQIDMTIGDALTESTRYIFSYGGISVSETLGETIKSFLFRFVGAESLLPIVGSGIQPIGKNVFSMSVIKFVTVEVFGYSPDTPIGVAPSLLGWFYIVGGNTLVVLGMLCFVVSSWVVWHVVSKSKLRCIPIAQAMLLLWFFSVASVGSLDKQYVAGLALIGSIAACEWIILTFAKRRPVKIIYKRQRRTTTLLDKAL